MKAIVVTKYGSPEDIELKEVAKPEPRENEVLVKVNATSVNYNTLMFVTGYPLVGRTFTGLGKPKVPTPGNDVAGKVEETGKKVMRFKPGDEVYGDTSTSGFGTLAEYVSVPETVLSLKPSNLSFAEAAGVPEAGLVALQALRDTGKIRAGSKVLINGASSGIGTFALQIAKYYGTEVTAVCGTRNVELARSLGADHVIDYTLEDFARMPERYDLILATAGYRTLSDYKKALKPGGIYVATGGSMKQIFQAMLLGPWVSLGSSKKLTTKTVKPNKDLDFMTELIETGKVKTLIDQQYPLQKSAEALQYYGTGHATGKVIITVAENG